MQSGLSELQREAILAELSALRRYCFSLVRDIEDADDLLQATVERVLSTGMPENAHPGKWLFTVCKNLWIDDLRHQKVKKHSLHMVADDPKDKPGTEREAHSQRLSKAVTEAIRPLPSDQRLALSLVAIEGKSYADAALILDLPIGTVMSRVSRARSALAACIEEYGDYGPKKPIE